MGRVKLVVILLGAVVTFVGFQEWRLALKAKPEPQQITLDQLAAQGPGGNAHITLSGYAPCGNFIVYESGRRGGSWRKVWIPLVSANSGFVPGAGLPSNVRVIFKTTKAKDEQDLSAILNNGAPFTGMVINEIESMGGQEKRLLESNYQGIDVSKCYIVQHGRGPAGPAQVLGMMGGGGALVLVGLSWVAAGRQQS
jgi:hypothetical protein